MNDRWALEALDEERWDPDLELEVFKKRPSRQQPRPSRRQQPRKTPAKPHDFSDALTQFVKDKVPAAVGWLARSRTFKRIETTLDAKYLYYNRHSVLQATLDALGVITQGPFKGFRFFELADWTEPGFDPASPAVVTLDAISVPTRGVTASSPLAQRGAFLERAVHGSVHAWRHVLGQRRPGKDAATRIRSIIDDEARTRGWELIVLNEIRASDRAFSKHQPTTGSSKPWAVERDFFDEMITGYWTLRHTFLELLTMRERLAAAERGLSLPQRFGHEQLVKGIRLSTPLTHYLDPDPEFIDPGTGKRARFKHDYPRTLFMGRVIAARWNSVTVGRGTYKHPVVERMRQEHAKNFFGGLAAYTKVP